MGDKKMYSDTGQGSDRNQAAITNNFAHQINQNIFNQVYAMQNQSENESALMTQMTRMNIGQAPTQQPFDMSGMMRDMAGMQYQMNREENMAKQMQEMTVNQPGLNMTSVNNAFGSLQLESQPDMEVKRT